MLDPLEQVVADQVAGGGFEPEARPQPGRPRCRRGDRVAAHCARAGSSGRAQPCSWLKASWSGPKVFSQPGGAMFKLRPVSKSHRAARTWT